MRAISMKQITELSDAIAEIFKPEQIILFGSHAYGMPHADSDVDLLVIMPTKKRPVYQAAEILNRINPSFPVDLLVRTPEQVQQRIAWNDFFLRDIVENGRVLYVAVDR